MSERKPLTLEELRDMVGKPVWVETKRRWVEKAYNTAKDKNAVVVMLLPARTDTKWFHDFCYLNRYATVRFVRGRLKFGGARNSAPFPSMVVIFRGDV